MDYLVEMKGITKKFPGVTALDNINFTLKPGEIHILLGENGAGKSTLMNILCGVYQPTSGTMTISGQEYTKLNPKLAEQVGVHIIHQELSLVNQLSIVENIFAGKLKNKKYFGLPVVDFQRMEKETVKLLQRVGLNKNPWTPVGKLSVSEQQQVEIAKSLSTDAKVIIMDEPTSSLTQSEIDQLFKIVRQLKQKNIGIIYITHKLHELKEIGDRVTVLKDGKCVGTKEIAGLTQKEMIFMMVGREIVEDYTNHNPISDQVIFSVKNMTRADKKVRDVSFDLHQGEILGFAGLIGSGRTELMNGIFRSEKITSGEVFLRGKKLIYKNPYQAMKQGIAFVTENRRELGFFKNFEIWKNISIESLLKTSKARGMIGLLNTNSEVALAKEQQKNLSIKCSSVYQNIQQLSGGNQQKVIIGKWLAANSEIIILDEPTKGIDVGAKGQIYQLLRELTNQGKGIIVVSSDLQEILTVCDRILVFNEGEIRTSIDRKDATEEKIMSYML